MTSFRVTGTTRQWQNGFLHVDEVDVESSDGETFTRSVVRHPGAVAVVPLEDDEAHALLVRQYRAALDTEVLEVVAGKRDVHDEPPLETARRELAEETGQAAGRWVKLAEFHNSPGFTDERTHLYVAFDLEDLGGTEGATAEERAMTRERVPLADVDEMIRDGRIVDAKTIIGLLLTQRYLAGAFRAPE